MLIGSTLAPFDLLHRVVLATKPRKTLAKRKKTKGKKNQGPDRSGAGRSSRDLGDVLEPTEKSASQSWVSIHMEIFLSYCLKVGHDCGFRLSAIFCCSEVCWRRLEDLLGRKGCWSRITRHSSLPPSFSLSCNAS